MFKKLIYEHSCLGEKPFFYLFRHELSIVYLLWWHKVLKMRILQFLGFSSSMSHQIRQYTQQYLTKCHRSNKTNMYSLSQHQLVTRMLVYFRFQSRVTVLSILRDFQNSGGVDSLTCKIALCLLTRYLCKLTNQLLQKYFVDLLQRSLYILRMGF